MLEFLHWNHSWNNYKYSTEADLDKAVALMKGAGAGWVRIDFLWQDLEPMEGEFDFEKYDYIAGVLHRNKINILGIFNYSPDWAASGGKWNSPPKETKSFVNYAVKVIERFKDKVKYWEVWNEPDSHIYWDKQDDFKSYCLLLKEVYIAAKKTDPECKILNGGFANGIASVNRLYENRAKSYFDILNIHIFESPVIGGAIERVVAYPEFAYRIMEKNGDAGKKIWITEIGCPGVKKGFEINNWWLGQNPDELQQAGWLRNIYTELLKDKHVEKIFWAFLRDCDNHWGNGTDYFGLLRRDFSAKPSFLAYKECFNNWRKGRHI